jgi:two-component system, OmpR family, sensor histidine kinase KdpD
MKEKRPDPDQLLKAVSKELKQMGRGHLKIFLGAYAGVGKTYAMLQAARQQLEKGLKVAIGIIETHDREETERLLEGFGQLPLRSIPFQGRVIQDFDLDAALSSGANLVLIDELAHTNPVGSRHAKRWGDVEELLAAGIDVYTTLNVQHLESVADIASGIIGTPVRETVPDSVFDDAVEVVLVDLPPDDLLARLDAGKVYVPVAIEHARQNFFRKGNLISLREIALRRVADRVDADVTSYRVFKSIETVWPTRERLMVCVSAAKTQERLIAEGTRLAQRLQAECLVVHVQEPSDSDDASRECVRSLAQQAEERKAEFINLPGDDVAEALLECARTRNVTKLVIGHGTRPWNPPWRRKLFERIARANPELGILLVAVKPPPRKKRYLGRAARPDFRWGSLALATGACALTTLVALWLVHYFDPPNLVALFVLNVVVISLRLGRVAAIWSALLSVASFDFFFIPPLLSFAMSDTQYLFSFALILVVAWVTSAVGSRLRADARIARAGERREAAVARVARDLSGAHNSGQIVAICRETIAPLFEAKVALILPDSTDRLLPLEEGEFADLSVAQWAYDHSQRAGLGTSILSAAKALYLPLKAPIRCRGVLAIQPQHQTALDRPDDKRLLEACCSSIALALERIHFAGIAQETLVRMEGERMRNSLLSAVSHDLRTPLTAIRGLAETLEVTELPQNERTEVASAIRHQAEDLQQLVTNLLDLARMQSAGVRLNKQWHLLDEIVGSALSRLGPVLFKREVRTELPSDLPLFEVDASLFERVLINLLDNALKYTPPDAKILIGAKAVGSSMYCFVEDNGPGLPPGDPEQFFKPFVRGQKESAISGVGLGLALCRSIIAAHGGTIRAEPAQPAGTRFEIRVPLGSPPAIEKEDAA